LVLLIIVVAVLVARRVYAEDTIYLTKNPFTTSTEFVYELDEPALVELRVYDLAGNRVKKLVSDERCAGQHTIYWDGTNDFGTRLSTGTYIYFFFVSDGNGGVRTRTIKPVGIIK